MANDVADLLLRIDATTEGLRRELKRAETSVDGATKGIDRKVKSIDDRFNSLGKTVARAGVAIGAAFAGMALAKVTSEFTKTNVEAQKLRASLVTVTGSVEEANKAWGTLEQFATQTPFALNQSVEGFIKMKALGLDPTIDALESFGNTASAMGKDLNQMIEAVADASTSEFERLKEFGIKAKQEGDRVSLTFQGVTTEIGNNSREIVEYLEQIGKVQFAGAMERQMDTLGGAISNLQDSFDGLMRAVGEAGAADEMTQAIKEMSDLMGDPKFQKNIKTLTTGLITVTTTVIELSAEFAAFGMEIAKWTPAALYGKAIGWLVDKAEELGLVEKELSLITVEATRTQSQLAESLGVTGDSAGRTQEEIDKLRDAVKRNTEAAFPHIRAAREYNEALDEMREALAAGAVSQEEFAKWLDKTQTDLLPGVTVEAERVTAEVIKMKEQADPMAVAYERGIERMRDGFGDFFQQILLDGKVTFGDLVDLFKRTVAEMIATAAANRIFLGVGLGGVSGAASAAGGASSLLTGGGASGLGGLGSLLSTGIGGSLIGGISGIGSALGLGAQTGAFLGSTGQLGYNALSALGIQGAGGTTSFLAGGALTAGAGILGGMAGNALGLSLTGRTSNSSWGAGLGGTAGAFLGGPLGAAIGGAIGGALDSAFGSSKNRIGGVGINTGTREANLWGTQRAEYQDPMQELANVLQGFSDAIGGSGSIMTISRGNKSPLQMDGVEFANVADLVAAAMDNILDTAWELAPVVKDLAKAFDGSVEETAAFARAMQGLWEQTKVNPISASITDFANAQKTVFDGYRDQMAAIRGMTAEFDGSVSSANALTQALAVNQSVAYQLAQQFMAVGQQISGSASSSAQSIRESVMTEDQRIQAWKSQRGGLRDSLGSLSDPNQIANASAEILRLNEQIFNALSPQAQQGQAEAFANYAEKTAEIADRRIDRLVSQLESEQRQQNAEVRQAMMDAASAQQEAANTMLAAAQIIQGAASSFGGGFTAEVVQ
ncbi:tape measure protein [Haliea salexigens]|uniref:tape measure protein n=1 Tax=Haliea salexigens TaxID=287487 RepID=UPI00040BDD49|nr:tape measure protein [Haliea salexigens]